MSKKTVARKAAAPTKRTKKRAASVSSAGKPKDFDFEELERAAREEENSLAEEARLLSASLGIEGSDHVRPISDSLAADAADLARLLTFVARNARRSVQEHLVTRAEDAIEAFRGRRPPRWHAPLVAAIGRLRAAGEEPFRSDAGVADVYALLNELVCDEGALPRSAEDAYVDMTEHWSGWRDHASVSRAVCVLRTLRISDGKAGGRGRRDRVTIESAAATFMAAFTGQLRLRLSDMKRPRKTTRRNSARE